MSFSFDYITSLRPSGNSCSLPCFKTHKAQCQGGQAAQSTSTSRHGMDASGAEPMNATSSPQRYVAAETSQSRDDSSGSADLEQLVQDASLKKLFDEFPNLRARLRFIFDAATAEDGQEGYAPARGPRPPKFGNSPEKRIARAMRILERDLDSDFAPTSGIKAFAELVAGLDAKTPRPDAG